MKKHALILLLLSLFFTSITFAATVTGRISGDRLQWFSGKYKNNDYLVSTRFDRISGLIPTTQWIPGTFGASTSTTLMLTSEAGDTVSVPAILVGATYQVNAGYSVGSVPPGAPICTESHFSSRTTVIDRSGGFCVAGKSATYPTAQEPFNQFQPILKLDRSALISAFNSKPTGTYSGTLSGTLRYGFYVASSGALTYRNIPVTFSVQLRNIGSYLSNVSVLGTGHIIPKYNTYTHTADGGTGYKITVMGAFETGLQFRFIGKTDDDYTLKPISAGVTKAIPYSISCNKCSPDTLLVKDGVLRNSSSWTRIEEKGKSISFSLNISYNDVKADDIVTGTYRDSFTLMLEAIL